MNPDAHSESMGPATLLAWWCDLTWVTAPTVLGGCWQPFLSEDLLEDCLLSELRGRGAHRKTKLFKN